MMLKRLACIGCLLLISGCTETLMQSLDREANDIIAERQREALGESGGAEDVGGVGGVGWGDGGRGGGYRLRPATRNDTAPPIPARSTVVGSDPSGPSDDLADPETATEPTVIDLEDALGIAIKQGREYRDRKEDLFLATLSLLAEQHLWGPRFFDTFTTRFVGVPESGDYDQVMDLVNSFGVRQRLPYGGEVSITALTSYVNYLRESTTTVAASGGGETQTGELAIGATLPLLRGGGVSAREELIQAERDLVYAVRMFERFRREYLVSISTDYYNLLLGRANLRSRENQTERFERLALRTQALADAGRESVLEVQRTENRLLQAHAALTSERQRYADAQDRLKIRLNMAVSTRLEITPVEVVAPDPVLYEAQAIRFAMANRLDFQTSNDRVADAVRRVKVSRNATLPGLDLFGSASLGTDPERRYGGFDLDAGTGDYEVGLTLDVPLDRRRERIAYRRAMVLAERAKRDHGLFGDRVIQEVRSTIRQIERARFTLELQERNLVIANRRLLRVQIRSLGPFEYLEAETELIQAQNDRDSALRDLRVAMLQYLLSSAQMRVAGDGQWIAPIGLMPIVDEQAVPDEQPDIQTDTRTDAQADEASNQQGAETS